MYGLDLFSGIGGITKALDGHVEPVAYCEIEPYARGVLLSRMAAGDLPRAPIWDDVSSLRGDALPPIDIIYGGFPCQDISVAGRGAGLGGERSGLFFEIMRLVDEIRPGFVFLENVPNIRTKGLDRVLEEFSKRRYDCRWGVVSAAEVGAPHLRKRWFLLAHASRELRNGTGVEGNRRPEPSNGGWWKVEPSVGRMVDELPNRLDRLRALGNAVVSAQAREAFERLMGLK